MIQHIIWVVCFFSLWLIIVWLQFLYQEYDQKKKKESFPTVTVCVPAYNEEKTVAKTIKSIIESNYPTKKIETIVVNDGSTDKTANVIRQLIKEYKGFDIKLINKKNGGKSSAINRALKIARGGLFAVVDADSRIDKNGIRLIARHFDDKNMGGVISRTRVENPRNIYEKIQKFEYIMSGMLRHIMAKIGTLSITPGVLSVYRTSILKDVGGFTKDRNNLTEDLEIAMRLKYNNYKVDMEARSVTHTNVPPKFSPLWNQRTRWARGFIYNHWKYRNMFFSKKHGFFGFFQMPINVLVVLLLVINISIITYMVSTDFFETIVRTITIKGYFISRLFEFPTMKAIILGQNLRIMFPLAVSALLGIILMLIAHRMFKENFFKNMAGIVIYFIFIPYFTTANWLVSVAKEITRSRRKW
jgi:cellulose synthase/poly-beta-1,6-N-acetylglucosamine synthase-like glycosyltransferase